MYYNTTHETGADLAKYQDAALSQDERLLAFFQAHPGVTWTRAEMHRHVLTEAPVASITRSLKTLTNKGLVEKTGETREGAYGRPCYTWRLAEREPEQQELL